MQYKEILPHPLLRQFIKCYWILENAYPPGTVEEVMPQSCYELLYQRQVPYEVNGKPLPRLVTIGALDRPLHLEAKDTKLWCVRFLPWGLLPFGNISRLPRNQATDASVVLHESVTKNLAARLPGATNNTMASIFDEVFLAALLTWQFDGSTITRIADHIKTEQGNVKVAELAEACFKSKRQIERDIAQATGASPREMLAKLRFEQAWKTLATDPEVSLRELAVTCGYSDQAHMTREFNRLAHMTPSHFSKQVKSMGIVEDPNVAFIQS